MSKEFQFELEARYDLKTRERIAARSLAYPSHWTQDTKKEFTRYIHRMIYDKGRDRTTNGRSLNELYGTYRRGAYTRHLKFELDFEQFSLLMQQPCHYCHQEPGWGVDRYDNFQGYVVENCVGCCGVCNLMKGTLTAQTFLCKCQAISTTTRIDFNPELSPRT